MVKYKYLYFLIFFYIPNLLTNLYFSKKRRKNKILCKKYNGPHNCYVMSFKKKFYRYLNLIVIFNV